MKKSLLIAVVLLSGCSLWMANYDTNEYALVNRVRTLAQTGDCGKREELYITALELKNFSQYIPRNQASIDLNSKLYDMVEDLHKRDNPSPVFCKLKLDNITKTAETIQQVTGSKPR